MKREPRVKTDRVEYSTFAGIDVWTGKDAEPDLTLSILEDGDEAVLNVKVYSGRADLTPGLARNLADALHRFADQYSPRDESLGIRLYGLNYPAAETIRTYSSRTEATLTLETQKDRGYVGKDGNTHHDIQHVEASVYPNWEVME